MANQPDTSNADILLPPLPPVVHSAQRGADEPVLQEPTPGEPAVVDAEPPDELIYHPVPFVRVGVARARCVAGKELQPLPFPIEDEE